MAVLSTIGYEGLSLDDFIEILRTNCIDTILDIRELPLSRKKGFSKTILKKTLESNNIQYIHIPELGCPKAIRHAYREDNDWAKYSEKYLQYMRGQTSSLLKVIELSKTTDCCLLCFEANPQFCHRRYVANAVTIRSDFEISIKHLIASTQVAIAFHSLSVDIPTPQLARL
jgi:uncharacterized protein (DUF488 family)